MRSISIALRSEFTYRGFILPTDATKYLSLRPA
jgi:hypothetical protein